MKENNYHDIIKLAVKKNPNLINHVDKNGISPLDFMLNTISKGQNWASTVKQNGNNRSPKR